MQSTSDTVSDTNQAYNNYHNQTNIIIAGIFIYTRYISKYSFSNGRSPGVYGSVLTGATGIKDNTISGIQYFYLIEININSKSLKRDIQYLTKKIIPDHDYIPSLSPNNKTSDLFKKPSGKEYISPTISLP